MKIIVLNYETLDVDIRTLSQKLEDKIINDDIDIEIKHTLNIDTLECSITATMNNTEWCLYKGHDLVMFEQLFDYSL